MPSEVDKSGKGGDESAANGNTLAPPALSLPKGGGAIRGMGEKFAANPVNGTGSMTVPIATSPGRSGFGPQLSLAYDSGAANGPFGFGWSLSLPSITRKTEKGLPRYFDADESDVFILSGAEDLVPVLAEASGQWKREKLPTRALDDNDYQIQRYRPRIEGLFARIERWTNVLTGEIHWRSISKDNITTLYGKDDNSRIYDPAEVDPQPKTRIFSWLICESYDDKGNAIVYEYQNEDAAGVDQSQAHEANRTDVTRGVNRYLKRIRYGNRASRLIEAFASDPRWMFEVVFDYGDEHYTAIPPNPQMPAAEQHQFVQVTPTPTPNPTPTWQVRADPFSSYRAGFEVRTYRLCRRVLMFHHFPDELGTADYLVRSTDFTYTESPIASFVTQATQSGYVRQESGSYLKKSLPPLEFQYTEATVSDVVRDVAPESLENLPQGLDGSNYQWVDLDGEGISGVLTEQAGAWFYKRNLSPSPRNLVKENGIERSEPEFAPAELVASQPAFALAGGAQFMDLAGNGHPDLVQFGGAVRGFYERTEDADWEPFRPFVSWPNVDTHDPNLKFVDLDGDGHSDIMITENDVLTWYPSLGEGGFGPAEWVRTPLDEEAGPRLVFADGTQSIYLADMSGDGLTDLVRIRNGEVCYWPNLGYGRFGAKVTMDNAPWFDAPDQFDQKRVRIADIDGSGNTDIIYLSAAGPRLYFNRSGNGWSPPTELSGFPRIDNLSAVTTVDLLGNGTACLVWSSPLAGDASAPMRYVDLMGGQKPHLLVAVVNNLGAETRVHYAPSTRFYLQDKEDGKPWVTRLPFPVHVVERVETYDRISRNRFVARYRYHHGYFDGVERELRGFGMVEQFDTEEIGNIETAEADSTDTNLDTASFVPPVLTKTWFHTGAYLEEDAISLHLAHEYFSVPGVVEPLLDDTILPGGLSAEEQREACRALKGAVLRQEVYAADGSTREHLPYSVSERNYTIESLQPRAGGNRHAVFFSHARETVDYHYERNPSDPRISHALTLEVDDFGNVLKSAAVGYGRLKPDPALAAKDQAKQTQTLITYTENEFTTYTENGVTKPLVDDDDNHRTPLPAEARTYELTGYAPSGSAGRFQMSDFVQSKQSGGVANEIDYERGKDINREVQPANGEQRRLIEHVRTLYRRNDLSDLLPFGTYQSLALPGESYKLAFTPGLLAQVYRRPLDLIQPPGAPAPESLLPQLSDVLPVDLGLAAGQAAGRGGYLSSETLRSRNLFPADSTKPLWTRSDTDGHWWIPSGRVFHSPNTADDATAELAEAQQHFFLPRRYRDPFHTNAVSTETHVAYDAHDLLVVETRDALDNIVTVETADDSGTTAIRIDYRVLQPFWITDPNGNRSEVVFDALGLVAGTAVMGKPSENLGDSLEGFTADLTQAGIDAFLAGPKGPSVGILAKASTRIVYDLARFKNTAALNAPQPSFAVSIARETHASDLPPPGGLKIQISLSYSDGFGREIQKKIPAEPGLVEAGGPVVSPRWVGSGWTIFNNKGKPVRQYEPFFSATHDFEFAKTVGVSPILFYDPVERVIATLHPNHTYEKVVFDPWRQGTYDVNDTVAASGTETGKPRTDADISSYVAEYFKTQPDPWPTWHEERITGAKGAPEKSAAEKAAKHANTPTVVYFDTLGRPFLSVADNGLADDGTPLKFKTRTELDIEGNQRAVIDARDRIVMRYDYDLLGSKIHQASMEAGERWMLNDVSGKPIRAWDSRGHTFRSEYDQLRRPLRAYVLGADLTGPDADPANPIADPGDPLKGGLFERTVYGEAHPDSAQGAPRIRNLRGKVYQQYDGAGVVTNQQYDFKGNLLESSRGLTRQYKMRLTWSPLDPLLSPSVLDVASIEAQLAPLVEVFTNHSVYDALNRPTALTTPDGSVTRPTFNEANLLENLAVNLRGDATPTVFVTNIDYNAKGQRELIEYGNNVRTEYEYDPQTFRLTRLYTARGAAAFAGDDPTPPNPPRGVQNLSYTYDPAGNITTIRDDAQQTIYFSNQVVQPTCDYVYDAIYRLIAATGREHIGQVGTPQTTWDDQFRVNLQHPHDGQAMRRYTEQYDYDEVGNFVHFIHQALNGKAQNGNWRRDYTYEEPSLIEAGKMSNRLSKTAVQPDSQKPIPEAYDHDAHGNMTAMPHLASMTWDFKDQFQSADLGGGGTAFYVYDAAGQRVRKVIERQNGTRQKERIYVGGYEIYREFDGVGKGITLERETLHVMDDKQRIALVETRIDAPEQLIRYQVGNHLASANLEFDHLGRVISYEENYPYGSTSYHALKGDVAVSLKRYRYAANERDEETGLYYHRARYYAPWLGRWTASDPTGTSDGVNLYAHAHDNPIMRVDPRGTDDEEPWLSRVSREEQEQASIDFIARARQQKAQAMDLTIKGPELWPIPDLDLPEATDPDPGYRSTAKPTSKPPEGTQWKTETFPGIPGYSYSYKEPDTTAAVNLSNAVLLGMGVVPRLATLAPEWFAKDLMVDVAATSTVKTPFTVAPTRETLQSFTRAFFESEGTILNEQAKQIRNSLLPWVQNKRLMVGVSTTVIEGEQITIATVSNPEAWNLLSVGSDQLPTGITLGPPPEMLGKTLNPMMHVEVAGPADLMSRGAKGVITGTAGPACEKVCLPRWTTGEFPTVLHTNLGPL